MECVGSDLPLGHVRWTAPEVLDEYIEEEPYEGKKLNFSKSVLFNNCRSNRNTRNIAVMVKMSILRSQYAMFVQLVFFFLASSIDLIS